MALSGLRIGILAGEASGDILGSRVLVALKQQVPDLIVEGIGGPLMEAQGLESLYPMERLAVMGFVEPLKRLPELLRIRRAVFEHFRANPPDIFLGIDSPDFNLHLEEKLRHIGITTAHLVSPSVWAWRQGRIKKIKRSVDLMLCLFPFETAIYESNNIAVSFVGHPLADEIPEQSSAPLARQNLGVGQEGPVVGLLPGSRGGEVKLLAPLFLQAARLLWQENPSVSFLLPAANDARYQEVEALLQGYPELPLTLLKGRSREVLAAADVVMLSSGTATLEALLLKRPMVVAYRMGALSWFLISRLAKTAYVALPNVLAQRQLVPELLQSGATAEALASTCQPLLQDSPSRQHLLQEFSRIHAGLRCSSAARSAAALLDLLAHK